MVLQTNNDLRPPAVKYPTYTTSNIEEYFYDWVKKNEINSDRIYLPIFFTAYYISKNYGKSEMNELSSFFDTLDKSLKYYAIVQYDDGIIDVPEGLDVLIFSAGGKGNVPIPLLADKMPDGPIIPMDRRKYLFSFVGANTHPIREKLQKLFKNHPSCYFSFDLRSPAEYFNIMRNTVIALCPRGYGKTSFRIYEAIKCRTYPLYITDDAWVPKGFFPVTQGNPTGIDELEELFAKNEIPQTFADIEFELGLDYKNNSMNILNTLAEQLTYENICIFIKNKLESPLQGDKINEQAI